jgi:hypothetical protein
MAREPRAVVLATVGGPFPTDVEGVALYAYDSPDGKQIRSYFGD